MQVGSCRRPLAFDDAIDTGIAVTALCGGVPIELMTAQHTVEFGSQPLDSGSTLSVEKVGAKFDRDAAKGIERVRKEEQLALRIDRAALHGLAIPSRADFNAAIAGVNVHEGGHSHCTPGVVVQDGKRQHRALPLQFQSSCNLAGHSFWRGYRGVPEFPQLSVLSGFHQVTELRDGERNQRRVRSSERNRSGKVRHG